MPFDVEAPSPAGTTDALGDTPRHLALVVDGMRGVLDVTVHGANGGRANSFDLYLPDPDTALGLASSVSFYGDGECPGESRMILMVGIRPAGGEGGR
jgi:hypothetical protein